MINLSPGPVAIKPEVTAAFIKAPISHRCDLFRDDFQATREKLCQLVNCTNVEIITGPGTLANEMVAAQLAQLDGFGLIITCGEFSNRLKTIASRQQLDFSELHQDMGEVCELDELEARLEFEAGKITWIWTTHCETSTGFMFDLERLARIANDHQVKLCLDCISTIGTVPLNLESVYLATATSGKALGSYAGLALIFSNHEIQANPKIPYCLDLGMYHDKAGIPFTISSALLYGLKKATEIHLEKRHDKRLGLISNRLRQRFEQLDLEVVIDISHSSPAVFTLAIPTAVSSWQLGHLLKEQGYLLSYESEYLVKKNYIQICLMSPIAFEDVITLPDLIKNLIPTTKASEIQITKPLGTGLTLSKNPL